MAILEWTAYHTEKEILRLAYERHPKSYWEKINSEDSFRGDEILNADLIPSNNYDLDTDGSIILWKQDKNLGSRVETVIMRF